MNDAHRTGRPRSPALDAQFIAAAVHDITEHGLHSLTVNSLTTGIRAGKGAFYRRWPDLDHFLVDIVGHLVGAGRDEVAAAVLGAAGNRVRDLAAGKPGPS